MDELLSDQLTLEADAEFTDQLERVAYADGMMLSLDAIRDEQHYHRRRLNRHHYWLHGYGTVCGLAVKLAHIAPQPDVEESIRITVYPGIAIDTLGREVLVNEPYCINLQDWLNAQKADDLLAGYDDVANTLNFNITVRHKDCLTGLQPTLARKLNASTDAVSASRNRDSVLLELHPINPGATQQTHPWLAHEAIDTDVALEKLLSAEELEYINAAPAEAQTKLRQQARLMHAGQALSGSDEAEPAEMARVLLARLRLDNVADINAIVIDPITTHVNNLVRPFVSGNTQLDQMI